MLLLNGAEIMCMKHNGLTVSRHGHATLVTTEEVLKDIKLREGSGRGLSGRDTIYGG